MTADQATSGMDESTMFLTAAGGLKHGRVKGFGSMLHDKVPAATTRARSKHTASSGSVLTNNEWQGIQSREELEMRLAVRERLLDEERAVRERKMAAYDLMFSQIYSMYGAQMPTSQVIKTNLLVNLGLYVWLC